MGVIQRYLMGEDRPHPKYEEWVIEQNADKRVHIHLKNIRVDMTFDAYNQLHDGIKHAYENSK